MSSPLPPSPKGIPWEKGGHLRDTDKSLSISLKKLNFRICKQNIFTAFQKGTFLFFNCRARYSQILKPMTANRMPRINALKVICGRSSSGRMQGVKFSFLDSVSLRIGLNKTI